VKYEYPVENLEEENSVKWNISVTEGKEFKRDFVSSGERKRIRLNIFLKG